MSFVPGEDAEELRGIVRGFLEKRSPESAVRELMETDEGYDPAVWAQAAAELGLAGLMVPEEFDGSGATIVELGVAFEEAGRALWCAPFFSTAGLAIPVVLACADEDARAELLPGLASGETIGTVAWGGRAAVHSTIEASGDTLTGTAGFVVDGGSAGLVLVVASGAIWAVEGSADGLTRTRLTSMDATRKLARLEFAGAPARRIGSADGLVTALDHATLLLAAEQLGGAQKVLETAVAYATDRIQFGRPIGSFQAIKHKLADMLVEVESARSVVYHGLWTAVHEPSGLGLSASLARAVTSEAYLHATADNIQTHGGIGFTWEHMAHLYFKRAKSSQILLGTPEEHRARMADELGVPGGSR